VAQVIKQPLNGVQGRALDADAQLTFKEKKELSETIQNLSLALDKVIQIIHDGDPDIADNTNEIEIEIDAFAACGFAGDVECRGKAEASASTYISCVV